MTYSLTKKLRRLPLLDGLGSELIKSEVDTNAPGT